MYCRLAKAADADVDACEAEGDVDDDEFVVVLVGAGEGVNGACCATLMFEMLRLKEAEGPVYVQWISVTPHVNISPACGKTKDGEELELAAAELLVDAGVAVVEGVVVDMMVKKRWGRERRMKLLQDKKTIKK